MRIFSGLEEFLREIPAVINLFILNFFELAHCGVLDDMRGDEHDCFELSVFHVVSLKEPTYDAVSYTHLTLPTIYSV